MTILTICYVFIGVIVGLIMGALPGLTVSMTTVLVVSLTYGWPMTDALAFIIGAYTGGVMGGSITSIAINIPGTSAAVATAFDGNPLKLKGEADNALNIALSGSFFGGIFGLAIMLILGPVIGDLALKFGSQEYFLLTLWGLTLIAILSKGSNIKGLISCCFGLFIGMIGMDPVLGIYRFTFGTKFLSGGVNFVAAMIGLFGMKEVIKQLSESKTFSTGGTTYNIRGLMPRMSLIKKIMPTAIWSAPLGTLIGILPGTGGDVGCFVAYGVAKQVTKNPTSPFGEGAYEGVAAPEVANDSAIGGALITMLTLGIPGDSVTAIILGSFYMHGLLPGPTFMLTQSEFFYIIAGFLAVGMIMSYVMGIFGSNLILKAINFPKWFLIPCITILCVVGSFAISNNLNDVITMLIFGVIGFIFEKANFPISPVVLSIILGPLIETNFRQALINTGGPAELLTSFATRPISLALAVLLVISVYLQMKIMRTPEKKESQSNE